MCIVRDESLAAGATGLSLRLMYSPGNAANSAELDALDAVVAGHGGIVVAHIRNEANLITSSLDELACIATATGVAIHLSHIKVTGPTNVGGMPEVLARLDHDRDAGIDVSTDLYPYEAGSTTVATIFLPWTSDNGNASLLEALKDPGLRRRVVRELAQPWTAVPMENYYASIVPEHIVLAGFTEPADAGFDGRSVTDIAAERKQGPAECLIDLTLAENGKLAVVLFQTDLAGMGEALRWPWTYIGTDGLPAEHGYVHPRLYGTFSRVLDRYASEGQILIRTEAVKRMTGDSAARFGLGKRGLLEEGLYADILIVEAGGPFDRAEYASPRQEPDGVRAVFINGQLAWEPGQSSSSSHGRFLSAIPVAGTPPRESRASITGRLSES